MYIENVKKQHMNYVGIQHVSLYVVFLILETSTPF
jgi:hypothetical protein